MYGAELKTLSKFYAEASEMGAKILQWKKEFKASVILLLNTAGQSWQPEYIDYPAGCVLAVGKGASLSVRTCSTDSNSQVLVRGWLIFRDARRTNYQTNTVRNQAKLLPLF